MLAIRMQRTGRKGHAMFRVIVQDSQRTPTSGKIVAHLGSYDPHAKTITIDKEKASFYLGHGAQPSDRVARLLKGEGVKLPDWVKISTNKKRNVRNPAKRRSTRPDEPKKVEEPKAEKAPTEEVVSETQDAPAEPSKPEKTEPETPPEPSEPEAPDKESTKTNDMADEPTAEKEPAKDEETK